MAPLVLYNHELSPSCRFVRSVAAVLGIELKMQDVKDVYTEMKTPEMLKKNPQHTIPLLDDNGFYIAESRAIATYLVSKYSKDDSLYPKDAEKRALVDQRLYFDVDIYAKIVTLYISKFTGKKPEASDVEKVNERLDVLNNMLEGKQFLAGDKITIADYAIANSVHTLEYIPDTGVEPAKRPNVGPWLSRVESSNSRYTEIVKKMRQSLKQ